VPPVDHPQQAQTALGLCAALVLRFAKSSQNPTARTVRCQLPKVNRVPEDDSTTRRGRACSIIAAG
jgi:hypothetical protein